MSENLPPGWSEVVLGEVVEVLDHRRVPLNQSERNARPGPFPYYGANGQVGTVGSFLFEGDHILLAEDGGYFDDPHRPNAYAVSGQFWVNNHAHILRAFPCIENGYLLHALNVTDLMPYVSGTTRLKLTQADMRRIPLRLPPLAEQRRIVARVEALLARTRRAREELKRTVKLTSHHQRQLLTTELDVGAAADWREVCIAEVAQVVTGTTPPGTNTDSYGGDLPFVKPTDLDAGYDVRTARATLSASGIAYTRQIPAGSTLVTCIGATIGKTGFARVPCATNQQINALVPRCTVLDQRWLYWRTVSPSFQGQILVNASATTLPIINKGRVEALRFKLPSLAAQAEAVSRIERGTATMQTAEREATRASALLDRLDAAILAFAFRGELVPKDPADEPAAALLARLAPEVPAAPRRRSRRAA